MGPFLTPPPMALSRDTRPVPLPPERPARSRVYRWRSRPGYQMSTSPVAIEPRAQRGSGSYSLVRLRVTLAFLAAYLVLVALAVYVAYQPVVEDEGTAALHPALLAALVGLVLPSLMAIVVRLILEPVARLDESRGALRQGDHKDRPRAAPAA